jgi:hypothetical protein
MVEKEFSEKALERRSLARQPPEAPRATADEGVRLIRAFVAVRSPRIRKAIVNLVENLG